MKPTTERLRRTVAEIEVRLDLLKDKKTHAPNIGAAMLVLEKLRDELSVSDETPIDVIGLSYETVSELEEIGITTVEQLAKKKASELLSIRRIGVERLLEIEGCLEVWKEWEAER